MMSCGFQKNWLIRILLIQQVHQYLWGNSWQNYVREQTDYDCDKHSSMWDSRLSQHRIWRLLSYEALWSLPSFEGTWFTHFEGIYCFQNVDTKLPNYSVTHPRTRTANLQIYFAETQRCIHCKLLCISTTISTALTINSHNFTDKLDWYVLTRLKPLAEIMTCKRSMTLRNDTEKFRTPIRTGNLTQFVEIECLSFARNYILKNIYWYKHETTQVTTTQQSSRFLVNNLDSW
jgi:hypothetical protein